MSQRMKWPRVTLGMFTGNLSSIYSFYSALGIVWADGEVEFGLSGYPTYMENTERPSCRPGIETGIPDLLGNLGDLAIEVYLRQPISEAERSDATLISIRLPGENAVKEAIAKLERGGLFLPAPRAASDKASIVTLLDPDGRHIELYAGGLYV